MFMWCITTVLSRIGWTATGSCLSTVTSSGKLMPRHMCVFVAAGTGVGGKRNGFFTIPVVPTSVRFR